uniref:Glycoside hydrolase family 5 domain-containing protein n=1 Tax=Globisporangium ultimum (strain ATCC 200006 / CBS 805.95 / DAOM BR144) TaxID=431595 RepID=K3X5L2_GLOUD
MRVTGATFLLLLALLAAAVLQTTAWEDAAGRTRTLQSITASNATSPKKKCTLRPKPTTTSGQNSTTAIPTPTAVAPKPTTVAPSPDTTGNEADPTSPSSGSATTLNFAAKPDGLYLNGAKFTIKGANYFGMEGELLVPHGLWGGAGTTTLDAVAKFLTTSDFNAVRLTLAVDAVLNNKEVASSKISNEKELQTAFSGKTLHYLDVLDYVVDVFAKHQILVLLNCHMLVANGGISPLWYTSSDNRNWIEDAWKILATRYKNSWNVIGADLKNEPHGEATWGSGDANTDWRLASLQMANTIHKTTSKWLIFVEGMDKSSRDDPNFPCFWGENLMDVERAPLELSVSERLVYSPHVYGPSVSDMSYFHDTSFPSNMPAIWDKHFGFIRGNKKYGGAMVIGEWGGAFEKSDDQTWQRAFAKYLKDNGLSWFYWAVNPNAGDTKGLLKDDWTTPREDKIALLSEFKGTPVP